VADYNILGLRKRQIVGLTVIQHEEKILSIKTIYRPNLNCFAKTRTSSIKTKHRMLEIDERMEKTF